MKTSNRVKYQRNIFTENQKNEIIHYFNTLKDNSSRNIADLMLSTKSRVDKIINDYLKNRAIGFKKFEDEESNDK